VVRLLVAAPVVPVIVVVLGVALVEVVPIIPVAVVGTSGTVEVDVGFSRPAADASAGVDGPDFESLVRSSGNPHHEPRVASGGHKREGRAVGGLIELVADAASILQKATVAPVDFKVASVPLARLRVSGWHRHRRRLGAGLTLRLPRLARTSRVKRVAANLFFEFFLGNCPLLRVPVELVKVLFLVMAREVGVVWIASNGSSRLNLWQVVLAFSSWVPGVTAGVFFRHRRRNEGLRFMHERARLRLRGNGLVVARSVRVPRITAGFDVFSSVNNLVLHFTDATDFNRTITISTDVLAADQKSVAGIGLRTNGVVGGIEQLVALHATDGVPVVDVGLFVSAPEQLVLHFAATGIGRRQSLPLDLEFTVVASYSRG